MRWEGENSAIIYRTGERKPHLAVGKACPLRVGMNRPL